MVKKMDFLTFPNFYKADFLEILWLLKREGVWSEEVVSALEILKSKQRPDGEWNLEREMHNMVVSVRTGRSPNAFVTKRANEVLQYYKDRLEVN